MTKPQAIHVIISVLALTFLIWLIYRQTRPSYPLRDGLLMKNPYIDRLEVELRASLEKIQHHSSSEDLGLSTIKCNSTDKHQMCTFYSWGSCLKERLSLYLRERISDLTDNDKVQLGSEHREMLSNLEMSITGYFEVLILSSVTSAQYLESIALVEYVRIKLFPLFTRAKLVLYDIDLAPDEQDNLKRICQCDVVKFPKAKLPDHCKNKLCSCWKPLAIRAHIFNANYVIWMDSTVRFTHLDNLVNSVRLAGEFGVQLKRLSNSPRIPNQALPSMFHHFGFTPCAFIAYPSAESKWGIFKNSALIRSAVLDPWLACSLSASCVCPGAMEELTHCPAVKSDEDKTNVGLCHLPDTALSLILARLWMDRYVTITAVEKYPWET